MRALIVIIFAVMPVGCANTTQKYGASTENNQILRGIENPRQIKGGAFTTFGPNKATIDCRSVHPLTVPSSFYEAYIREALVDELKVSGIYSETANTELTMHFEQIGFNSAFVGNWIISARFTIAGKPPFKVTTNYGVTDVNWGPALACSNTAAAFVPAVQNSRKPCSLTHGSRRLFLAPANPSRHRLVGKGVTMPNPGDVGLLIAQLAVPLWDSAKQEAQLLRWGPWAEDGPVPRWEWRATRKRL